MSRLMDIARNFEFDPSRPLKGRFAVRVGCDISDKSDKRGPSGLPPCDINDQSPRDPYQERARAALVEVCRLEQLGGMVPWLRQNHPSLYDELVSKLPDQIHHLWEGQAPLDELQRILDIWLEAYRTGREMYQRGQGYQDDAPQSDAPEVELNSGEPF